jgi:hypothetical protein
MPRQTDEAENCPPCPPLAPVQPERILVLDEYRGVKFGGRFDGWLMRRAADGQWVTVRKLPEEDPFAHISDDLRELYGLPRMKP